MSRRRSWPPPHELTLPQLAAAFAVPGGSWSPVGSDLGRDLLGGRFCFDPFAASAAGERPNPNLVVFGQLGRGKSALVKTLLRRQLDLGREVVVVDPKGEYGPLASAAGTAPLRLEPGGRLRLNPLDQGESPTVMGRNEALVAALVTSGLGTPLTPRARAALGVALRALQPAQRSLPAVAAALLDPAPSAATGLHTTVGALREDGRDLALELRRLVVGDLAGMFDGTDATSLPGGPLQVLDLSRLRGSAAVPMLMTCALAALSQVRLGSTSPRQRLVIIDEAWAILQEPAIARYLQASWKLARATGIAHLLVLHRASDLQAVGPAGSATVALAEGLLADSETVVCFGLPHGEARAAGELLGLGSTAIALLPTLPRGVALWRLGGRSHLVALELSADEVELFDTDGAMR